MVLGWEVKETLDFRSSSHKSVHCISFSDHVTAWIFVIEHLKHAWLKKKKKDSRKSSEMTAYVCRKELAGYQESELALKPLNTLETYTDLGDL